MRKFLFLVLLVLVFRSSLGCWGWESWEIGEKKKEVIDVTPYLKQKCEVCGKPFNYSVTIDSSCKVINDKTEEYLGRKMHKGCYEKLIDFLIYDYQKRWKEYDFLSITCSSVSLSNFIISPSTSTRKKN